MANAIGTLKQIMLTEKLYSRFPGHLNSVYDAVNKNDLNKVISYFRQSNLKHYVLYYLIDREKYVVEDL
jgi:hypothetical protein